MYDYKSIEKNILDELSAMTEVSGVLDFFRSVYFGSDKTNKEYFSCMMFLADQKCKESEDWVRKAINDFNSKKEFEPFRSIDVPASVKCLIVKKYRMFVKELRKSGELGNWTNDDICIHIVDSL